MKKLAGVSVLLLGVGLGYALRYVQDRADEDGRLRTVYHEQHGQTPVHFLTRGLQEHREAWKRVMGAKLRADLEQPWHPGAYDQTWGPAFAVLRDAGPDGWAHRPDMTDPEQDEMVRYLCYRIEAMSEARTQPPADLRPEFAALETYPPETLARQGEMLTRTVDSAFRCAFGQVVYVAQGFLASQVRQEWARSQAWDYLARTAHSYSVNTSARPAYMVEYLVWQLEEAAREGEPQAARLLLRFVDQRAEVEEHLPPEHKLVVDRLCDRIEGGRDAHEALVENAAQLSASRLPQGAHDGSP